MSDRYASSHPEAGVKVPKEPEDPVPGEVEPTPEEDAALKKSAAAVKELVDIIKV